MKPSLVPRAPRDQGFCNPDLLYSVMQYGEGIDMAKKCVCLMRLLYDMHTTDAHTLHDQIVSFIINSFSGYICNYKYFSYPAFLIFFSHSTIFLIKEIFHWELLSIWFPTSDWLYFRVFDQLFTASAGQI